MISGDNENALKNIEASRSFVKKAKKRTEKRAEKLFFSNVTVAIDPGSLEVKEMRVRSFYKRSRIVLGSVFLRYEKNVFQLNVECTDLRIWNHTFIPRKHFFVRFYCFSDSGETVFVDSFNDFYLVATQQKDLLLSKQQ